MGRTLAAEKQTESSWRVATGSDQRGSGAGGGLNAEVVGMGRGTSDAHLRKSFAGEAFGEQRLSLLISRLA